MSRAISRQELCPGLRPLGPLHALGPKSLLRVTEVASLPHTPGELNINVPSKTSVFDSRVTNEIKLNGSKALQDTLLGNALHLSWPDLEATAMTVTD